MPVELDIESIRKGAGELDAATEAVQALVDQFRSAVEGLSDCFGGDAIGSLLDIAHQVVMEALSECITTNIEDLLDYANSLREMADNHEATDNDIAALFNQLLAELGG